MPVNLIHAGRPPQTLPYQSRSTSWRDHQLFFGLVVSYVGRRRPLVQRYGVIVSCASYRGWLDLRQPCRWSRSGARGIGFSATGSPRPVHTNGAEMLSCPHGDYRSSVRAHCTGPSRSARERQTVELASAQRDSVCRRAGLPVAGVAAPIRQLAYRLHTDEPLVEEWGARPGV